MSSLHRLGSSPTPIQHTEKPKESASPSRVSSGAKIPVLPNPKSFDSGNKAPVLSGNEMQSQISSQIDQSSSQQILEKSALVPQPNALKEMKAKIMKPETQATLNSIDKSISDKVLNPLKQEHQRLSTETHDDGVQQVSSNPLAGLKAENKLPTMMKLFASISKEMDKSVFKGKSLDKAEQFAQQLMMGSSTHVDGDVLNMNDMKLVLATHTESDIKNDLAKGFGFIKDKYQGTTDYSQLSDKQRALVDKIYDGMKSGIAGQEQQIIAKKTLDVNAQIGKVFNAPTSSKAVEFMFRDKNETMVFIAQELGVLSEESLNFSKENLRFFSDQILGQLPQPTQQLINACYTKVSMSLQESGGQISDETVKLPDKDNVEHDAPKTFTLKGQTYEATAFLGKGGFGKVFEYSNKSDPSQKLVIKEMLADDEMGRLDIKQEIKAHAHLMGPEGKGSPHIVNMRGIIQAEGGKILMVMDKAETDLDKALVKLHDNGLNQLDGRQKSLIARFVARETMESLQFVQKDMNSQHMDIKPENMLIGSDGKIMVADFGSTQSNHEEWNGKRKEDGAKVGVTPKYVAPELDIRRLDQKYDTWSIGVMMHDIVGEDFNKPQALTGQARQTSDTQKNLTGFDNIVNALNHPDPTQRPTLNAALSHSYFQDPELNTPELKQLWVAMVNGDQAEVNRLKDLI